VCSGVIESFCGALRQFHRSSHKKFTQKQMAEETMNPYATVDFSLGVLRFLPVER
jgi:hypothetical protein